MKKSSLVYKLILSFVAVLFISIACVPIAKADLGPKPTLDIIVDGIDTDNYYLDLLAPVSNYKNFESSLYEEVKNNYSHIGDVTQLKELDYVPVLTSRAIKVAGPTHGYLTGEKLEDGRYLHRFSYITPSQFKIMIILDNGNILISDEVTVKRFYSTVVYSISIDESKGDVTLSAGEAREYMPWIGIGILTIILFLGTLVIEVPLGLLFGFRAKNSIKAIVITNVATQIILNSIIIFNYLVENKFFILLISELLVFIIELIVYIKYLTERKVGRRIAYALTANIVTFIIGLIVGVISYFV